MTLLLYRIAPSSVICSGGIYGIVRCIAIEIVLVGLLSTLHLCFSAKEFASSLIVLKHCFLSFLRALTVDLPIERRVMKRSTIGAALALPGYFFETE